MLGEGKLYYVTVGKASKIPELCSIFALHHNHQSTNQPINQWKQNTWEGKWLFFTPSVGQAPPSVPYFQTWEWSKGPMRNIISKANPGITRQNRKNVWGWESINNSTNSFICHLRHCVISFLARYFTKQQIHKSSFPNVCQVLDIMNDFEEEFKKKHLDTVCFYHRM